MEHVTSIELSRGCRSPVWLKDAARGRPNLEGITMVTKTDEARLLEAIHALARNWITVEFGPYSAEKRQVLCVLQQRGFSRAVIIGAAKSIVFNDSDDIAASLLDAGRIMRGTKWVE